MIASKTQPHCPVPAGVALSLRPPPIPLPAMPIPPIGPANKLDPWPDPIRRSGSGCPSPPAPALVGVVGECGSPGPLETLSLSGLTPRSGLGEVEIPGGACVLNPPSREGVGGAWGKDARGGGNGMWRYVFGGGVELDALNWVGSNQSA